MLNGWPSTNLEKKFSMNSSTQLAQVWLFEYEANHVKMKYSQIKMVTYTSPTGSYVQPLISKWLKDAFPEFILAGINI